MGIDKYREFGIVARQKVQDDMLSPGSPLAEMPFRLTAVDNRALAYWPKWQDRRVNWNWNDAARDFRNKSRRLEIAAWVGSDLAGLALAVASDGEGEHSNVTLHLLERAPGSDNPLAGIFTDIIVDAMDAYAILLGRQHLKLKNPASGMISTYIDLDFADAPPINGQAYMQRRVRTC